MSNIAIIPQVNLPAELMSQFAAFSGADDLNAGVSSGFPVMSIRGAKWRIAQGGEETPICMPGTKDLAPFVNVVIMRANPALSKTYYEGAFVEGSDAPPACSSNDGIAPLPDSPKKQCDSCAACPQNVWGSKISPSGTKIKACADVRRLAVLPADDLGFSPILLRVPGASLSDLAAYGKALKQRGIPSGAVVTKLSFDPDASYPKIVPQFSRMLTGEEMALVASRLSESVVDDILGTGVQRTAPQLAAPAPDKFGIPDDVAVPAAAAQADDLEEAVQQVEAAAAPAAKPKAAKKTEPAPEPAAAPSGDMLGDIEDALASLNM